MRRVYIPEPLSEVERLRRWRRQRQTAKEIRRHKRRVARNRVATALSEIFEIPWELGVKGGPE